MSESKRTFGLLAAVVVAATLFFGFSIGVIVAKPKTAAAQSVGQSQAQDLYAENREFYEEVERGEVETLVDYYSQWNELCRGYAMGSGLTCNKREVVGDILESKGMCYGKAGQYGYQKSWHACVSDSCRPSSPC